MAVTIYLLVPLAAFSLAGVTGKQELKVSSILVYPYLMKASDGGEGEGNMTSEYEGYIKDLMDKITTKIPDTSYTFAEVRPSESADSWNAMIDDLVQKKAEVAAGPLTETIPRDKKVDFTQHFQKYEAVIVMQKRDQNDKPIETIEDFLNLTNIKYGTIKDSSMANYLKQSKGKQEKKLWDGLTKSAMFLSSNQEGIDKIQKDKDFAFLMVSSAAYPVANREPCNLQVIPTGVFKRKYALAVQNLSHLRDKINFAIYDLIKESAMDELKKKWLEQDTCSVGGAHFLIPQITTVLVLSAYSMFVCL